MFPAKEKVWVGEIKVRGDAINLLVILTRNCISGSLTVQWKHCRIFPLSSNMTTLRDKRKLAAINGDNDGDRPWNNQARNTNSPRIQIEDRVTKKLSQELTKTGSGILGTLSRLDDFLLNPQVHWRDPFFIFPQQNHNCSLMHNIHHNWKPKPCLLLGNPFQSLRFFKQ